MSKTLLRLAIWLVGRQQPNDQIAALDSLSVMVDDQLCRAHDESHALDCAALGMTPSELAANE